jgi:hypothetical protein
MKKLLTLLFISSSIQFALAQPITSICVVTVTEAGANEYPLIVWDRNDQISVAAIDSIFIYRDDINGTDSLIAKVDYDDLSEYHDVNSNAGLRAYRYKIQGKDINGGVGPLSVEKRTIHFILYENVQQQLKLEWTPYVNSTFTQYNCWDLVDLVTPVFQQVNTGNGWTFTSAVPGTTYEMKVDLDGLSPCTSTNKANHNTARSNKSTISFDGNPSSSINENDIQEIKLYPNPTDGNATLTFSSLSWKDINVSIFDVSGRLVKTVTTMKLMGQYTLQLDLESLEAGYYNVVINNGLIYSQGIIKK